MYTLCDSYDNPNTSTHHFRKDAADTPDVHGCGVVLRAEEQLRWPVPQSDHLQTIAKEENDEYHDNTGDRSNNKGWG